MDSNALNFLISVSQNSLKLILILSAPTIIVAMAVGLFISLIQATTQIQEQTLTFVPKLVAVMIVIAITGKWTMDTLAEYTTMLFQQFPQFIR